MVVNTPFNASQPLCGTCLEKEKIIFAMPETTKKMARNRVSVIALIVGLEMMKNPAMIYNIPKKKCRKKLPHLWSLNDWNPSINPTMINKMPRYTTENEFVDRLQRIKFFSLFSSILLLLFLVNKFFLLIERII